MLGDLWSPHDREEMVTSWLAWKELLWSKLKLPTICKEDLVMQMIKSHEHTPSHEQLEINCLQQICDCDVIMFLVFEHAFILYLLQMVPR